LTASEPSTAVQTAYPFERNFDDKVFRTTILSSTMRIFFAFPAVGDVLGRLAGSEAIDNFKVDPVRVGFI
ncbi:MAG: hypothetical protein ACREIC_32530, partial [Limisphaerales bacterium]